MPVSDVYMSSHGDVDFRGSFAIVSYSVTKYTSIGIRVIVVTRLSNICGPENSLFAHVCALNSDISMRIIR